MIKRLRKNFLKNIWPYTFISPFFILFAIFWIGPIIMSFYYSFLQWDGMGEAVFIGIENYKKLFTDPIFFQALKNTFVLTITYEIILIPTIIILSVLLNNIAERNLAGKYISTFIRSSLFIPITMAMVVVAIVFDLVLGQRYGTLNVFLNTIGILSNVDWIHNPKTAIWVILILRLWRNTGFYMIFVLAGLKSLPREIYEAAEVDGANSLGAFFRITLPLLKNIVVFVVFMSLIWQFQIFDEPWVLTEGGPSNATLVILIYLFKNSFQYSRVGYGSAISYVFTLILVMFAILQIRLFFRERKDR
jgi:lactose/L-arabinose transport system permease protein